MHSQPRAAIRRRASFLVSDATLLHGSSFSRIVSFLNSTRQLLFLAATAVYRAAFWLRIHTGLSYRRRFRQLR